MLEICNHPEPRQVKSTYDKAVCVCVCLCVWLFVSICVSVFLNLLNADYKKPHSTSKLRTFLLVVTSCRYRLGLKVGFRTGLVSGVRGQGSGVRV